MTTRRQFAAIAAASLLAPRFAHAQEWPNRPVTIIVPFAPGGATDIVARLLAEELRQRFGQPFIVENRTGAAGNIGVEAVIVRPRRLHAAARDDGQPHHQSAPVHGRQVQGRARPRAHLADVQGRPHPGRESQGAGEERGGARGLRQGESGQAHLRLGRRRLLGADVRRPARDAHRHQAPPRSLQGIGARAHRCRGGTHRHADGLGADVAAADRGREHAAARGDQRDAQQASCRTCRR